MTSSFLPYLVLSGLLGFHCEIITVRKVSVKTGSSVSIPCLYVSKYRSNEKYLCKGSPWEDCSYVVWTNKPDPTGKFSISDDRRQNILTVAINNTDKSKYWCAVDRGIWRDEKAGFWLSVTPDVPNLYVDQQDITALEGGSVTVSCYYKIAGKRHWCRLGEKLTCVEDQTGSIHGAKVSISKTASNAFEVTMSRLRTENSGWYWCDNGDFQMPVHITVLEMTSSTVAAMTTNAARTTQRTTQFSSVPPNVKPNTTSPMHSTESQTRGESLKDEHESFTKTVILIIVLVSLLLLVAAALLGWRMSRWRSKPEASVITGDSQTGNESDVHYSEIYHNKGSSIQMKDSQTGDESDVQYSEIHHNKGSSSQVKNQIPEDSVTYSTIVKKDLVTEPADGSVIYSTVKKQD